MKPPTPIPIFLDLPIALPTIIRLEVVKCSETKYHGSVACLLIHPFERVYSINIDSSIDPPLPLLHFQQLFSPVSSSGR